MTRNPTLRPNGSPPAGRPQRMLQQTYELKASILRISVSVADGFSLVVLLTAWWR